MGGDTNCMLWGVFLVAICCPLKLFVYRYYSLFSFLSVTQPFTDNHNQKTQLISSHSVSSLLLSFFTAYTLMQEVGMTSGNPCVRHIAGVCVCVCVCIRMDATLHVMSVCGWTYEMEFCISCSAETLPARATATVCLHGGSSPRPLC